VATLHHFAPEENLTTRRMFAIMLNPIPIALSAMFPRSSGIELALLGSRSTFESNLMNQGSVNAGISKRTLKGAKTAPNRGETVAHECSL